MAEEKREEQTLSDLIRARRMALGLSQEELAEKLNVSRQAVAKWESGKSFPASERLLELCRVLEIPAEQLLHQEAAHEQEKKKKLRPAQVLLIVFAVGLVLIWGGAFAAMLFSANGAGSTGGMFPVDIYIIFTLIDLSLLWLFVWFGILVVYVVWQVLKRL